MVDRMMDRAGRAWSLLAAAGLVLLTVHPAAAQAEEKVYLWGFQRGCEQLEEMNRLVERRLYGENHAVGLLRSPQGQPLPPCQGERCAQALKLSCTQAQGRVVGGQVVQGRDVLMVRLWMHDLATGQTAYQDDYCQSCGILSALSAQTRRLIQQPRFGVSVGPKPSYCDQQTQTIQAPVGPLLLTVFGDSKHKATLQTALRGQLETLGRTVLPVTSEPRSYSLEALKKLVAGQDGARVLGADVQKDGKVALFLFDQKTELTEAKTISCPDCERDSLIAQVKQGVSELLDRCIGFSCAGTASTLPAEACQPFPEQACPGADILSTVAAPSAINRSGAYMDARTAKIIKGLTWGAFAASAATSISLFAVSSTSVGTYTGPSGIPVSRSLDAAAFATLGITGALLAIAIPTTVVINHAAANSGRSGSVEPGQSTIQCPN